jgi:LuxR family maltose regulon positive regulatory protein
MPGSTLVDNTLKMVPVNLDERSVTQRLYSHTTGDSVSLVNPIMEDGGRRMAELVTGGRYVRYTVPKPLRHEISRTAALKKLQHSEARIIVLEAPSGYGKTTLAAQYARASDKTPIWVTLTADDALPETLFRSIAQAVSQVSPNFSFRDWEQVIALDAENEIVASALANDFNRSPENYLMVFDSVAKLSQAALSALETFVRCLGEGHQVLLTSYGEQRLNLARDVAAGDVAILDATTLAFDQEETQRLFRQTNYQTDVDIIHEAVSGWPAAIGLIAQGPRSPLTSPQALIGAIIASLPSQIQQLLPEVSVLEVWDEEGPKILGINMPDGWLSAIRKSGLPLTPLDDGVFQPHTLVLEVLAKQLRQQPERRCHLLKAAAGQAESKGQPIQAIEYLLAADRHHEAAALIDGLLPRWQQHSEWLMVRQALEKLPLDSLMPEHKAALGVALIETGDPGRGEVILTDQMSDQSATGWSYLGLLLLAYRRGEWRRVIKIADQGVTHARGQPVAVQLLRGKATALCALDQIDDALVLAEECVAQAEALGQVPLIIQALTALAFVKEQAGYQEEAFSLANRANHIAAAAGMPHKALPAVNTIFAYHYQRGTAGEAFPLVTDLLTNAKTHYPLAVPWMLRQVGYAYFQSGHFAQALQAFEESATHFERAIGDLANAGEALAEAVYCYLKLGQVAQASPKLGKVRELLRAIPSPVLQSQFLALSGYISFYAGSLDEARLLLEQSRHRPPAAQVSVDQIRVAAYLADIARQQGRLSEHYAGGLIHLLDRYGSSWPLTLELETFGELLATFVTRRWFPERFKAILDEQPVSLAIHYADVLEVWTLGNAEVRLNGQLVHLYPKAQELLVYLCLYGPVRREQIADDLWRQLDAEAGRHNLKMTNRRIRSAFAETLHRNCDDLLVFSPTSACYALSNKLDISLDVTSLERALYSPDDTLQLEAVFAYNGDFLAGHEAEWISVQRAHAQRIALNLCLSLAQKLQNTNVPLACQLYQRALKIDPFAEDVYLALINLYSGTGNTAAASMWITHLNELRDQNCTPTRLHMRS